MKKIRETILQERYFFNSPFYKDNNEAKMWERVCKAVDLPYGNMFSIFYELVSEKRFSPNSPTIFNAFPNENGFMGSACFVIEIEDSMQGIMNAANEMAIIFKYGGGVGATLDNLRPKGALVSSGIAESSGPVSFMNIFNSVGNCVMQGGKRRAALLLNMSVYHPDIMDFIKCKNDNNSLNMMNISVKIDKNFLDAVKNEKEITPIKFDSFHNNVKLNAKEIYNEIIKGMWKNGEPGILFIDKIEEYNPIPEIKINSTNPCGEQPLHPYSSCNLGSINLNHPDCIKNGKLNFDYIKDIAYKAVYFLNGVIYNFNIPVTKFIDNVKRKIRPIGLGVTGFAELLIKLNIVYGSKECLDLIDEIGTALIIGSTTASVELVDKFGKFEYFNKSLWANKETRNKMLKIKDDTLDKLIDEKGISNSTLTCIAPTGTISILLECASSGIEPLFKLVTNRKFLKKDGTWDSDNISCLLPKGISEEDVLKNDGVLKGLVDDLHVLEVYRTALEISPKEHIDVQAKWQQYVHAAISKTINLPESITEKDIEDLCFYAYEKGCKGFTVYRDSSREFQVLSTIKNKKTNEINLISRPTKVNGDTYRIELINSSAYITVNCWNNSPKEVFLNISKQGNEFSALCSAIGRLISIALQHNVPLERIIDTLKNHKGDITGSYHLNDKMNFFSSLPDLLSKILALYNNISENNETQKTEIPTNKTNGIHLRICPQCAESFLTRTGENCYCCKNCGYSSCD